MAEIGRLTRAVAPRPWMMPVMLLRVVIELAVLLIWQFLSASGWFYRGVVPSLPTIAGALAKLLSGGDLYWNLWVTIDEIAIGLAIGGLSGLVAGLVLGCDKKSRQPFDESLEVGMICRRHCFDNGVVMRAVGDRMIIAPPLVISVAQIDEMIGLIRRCLDLTYDELRRAGQI